MGLGFAVFGLEAVRWLLKCRTKSGTTSALIGLICDIRQNDQGHITYFTNPTRPHITVVLNLFQHLRPQSMDSFVAGLGFTWVHARALAPEMPD